MVASSRDRSFWATFDNAKHIICFGLFQTQTPPFCTFWYIVIKLMAPVVRVEMNGSQALLSHDDVVDDLVVFGWVKFVQSFEGFNLEVAQDFAKTFDGARDKIGDLQLQVDEESIAEATGLSREGDHWFKNLKIEGIPWHLLMISRKSCYNVKGTPIHLFKTRWHGLLLIIKQFVTCEGRYGLVFLFHVRLLMVFLGFKLNLPFYFLKILQKMSRFYQRQNPNSESSLFHHGLIWVLVNSHLLKVGDSWQGFLVRNGFVSLPPEPVNSLPLCVDESIDPCLSSHSLQGLRVELQVSKDPALPPDTPIDSRQSVKVTSRKHKFIPKKSLEEVLSHLRGKVPVVPNPVQKLVYENKIKIKRQGKKNTQRVDDIDFRNKRNGRLLSRMTRNRHQNRDKPIPTVDIEDVISVDDASSDATKIDSPQYDFVSNLPPFLKEQEGFSGIQYDLKRVMEQDKPLNSDHTLPLPNLEQVYCEDCFNWIQRYYQDIPYLQAQLNQVMARNLALEKENEDLRASIQLVSPRANKRFRRSGDIIIKNSTNFNVVINSELSHVSFSKV
jgi:hypothetical protein